MKNNSIFFFCYNNFWFALVKMARTTTISIASCFLLALVYLIVQNVANKLCAIAALYACTTTFVHHLPLNDAHPFVPELSPFYFALFSFTSNQSSITAKFLHFSKTAHFSASDGCMIYFPYHKLELNAKIVPLKHKFAMQYNTALQGMMDANWMNDSKSRAIIVMQKGAILAESYSHETYATSLHLGWSMSKTMLSAMIGFRKEQIALNVHDAVPIKEWQHDARKNITWDSLLRMSSGLEFVEDYENPFSDVVTMLYAKNDVAKYAIEKQLGATKFSYSTGTSNILSYALKQTFASEHEYVQFVNRFFQQVGLEGRCHTDGNATYIMGSFCYLTAHSWVKFGYLYVNNGVSLDGNQIFSKEWLEYTRTSSPLFKDYGAHIWLAKDLPFAYGDEMYAWGFHGQYLVMSPSQKLVMLRLGIDDRFKVRDLDWNVSKFVKQVKQILN